MGKALAEAFPAARAVFDEVDAALGEKLTAIIWDGPAETLQLTENAQPALMAVSLADPARAGDRGRLFGRAGRRLRRRTFARRIFRAGRRRQPQHHRHRAAVAHPRPCHAEGGAGRRRRHGRVARSRLRGRGRGRERGRAGSGLPGRQRQWRRTGRGLRRQGRRRARARDRQDQGRQARHAAAGVGAVPLPADAARGRRDGRSACRRHHQAAGFAVGVERAGRADHRSGRDPPPPDRTGHRNRALARVGRLHGEPRRHPVFRNRRRQGAERAGQAHRRRRRRHFGRRARTILLSAKDALAAAQTA